MLQLDNTFIFRYRGYYAASNIPEMEKREWNLRCFWCDLARVFHCLSYSPLRGFCYLPPSLPPFLLRAKIKTIIPKGAYTHDRASLLYYYHYHYFSKRIKYTDILINVDSWLNSREILKRFLSGFHFSHKENLQCRSEFFFYLFVIIFLLLSAKWKTISSFKSTENRNLGWHK